MIKLLSPTVNLPNEDCFIDLEKRIPYTSEYLAQNMEDKFDFDITVFANNEPFFLSKELCLRSKNNFDKLGTLFKDNKNDLDELIINSIKFIAKAIRETDLHLRVSFI